jgi:hypothetical protein
MSKSSSKKMPLYRHGDVLVRRVSEIPATAKKRPHLTLAEGEITGHSHRVAESGVATLYENARERYLEVYGPQATLVHEEHGPITLTPGYYRVWQQREYSPQEIRIVRD